MKTIVNIKVADVTLKVIWLGGDEHEVILTDLYNNDIRREFAPTLAYAFYLVAKFSAIEADTDGSIGDLIYTI